SGFYLEVTKPNLHLVPPDYQRRSSTVGAERFIMPALDDHEARVLSAEERRAALEQQIFEELRAAVLARRAGLPGAPPAVAQAGSFVPAQRARIGLVDRLFTRVGAADDLARGQSTFMVEMAECARILHQATPRSLLLLDEVGRGTSTFDGLALAWAIAEHLHDVVGARTLFASHYHELCDLSREKPRAVNLTMAVTEVEGSIVFLRKVVPGAASRSYGIQVAKLAGLPDI